MRVFQRAYLRARVCWFVRVFAYAPVANKGQRSDEQVGRQRTAPFRMRSYSLDACPLAGDRTELKGVLFRRQVFKKVISINY